MRLPSWFERPRSHRGLVAFVAVAAVAAAGGALVVAWLAGFDAVVDALAGADPIWLLPCFLAQPVAYAAYAVTLRELSRHGPGRAPTATEAVAASAVGFGAFLPKGGFSFDLERMRRRGVPAPHARRRVFALGAAEYAILAPAAWVAALELVGSASTAQASLTWPWLVGVPAGVALAIPLYVFRERVPDFLGRAVQPLELALRIGPLGYAALAVYWAADVVSLWAGLRVFGLHPGAAETVLGFATGYALSRRSLPLAGAGITEALLAFSLRWAGLPLAPSLLGVIFYRLANVWLGVVPAIVALPRVEPTGVLDERGTS